jgi:hypothetical protein
MTLTDLTSAGAALKGIRTSLPVLDKALLHTPEGWKDSGKLMYEKVKNLETTLRNALSVSMSDVNLKRPGLSRVVTGGPVGKAAKGGGQQAPAGKITVVTPDGPIQFNTQEEANRFRELIKAEQAKQATKKVQ